MGMKGVPGLNIVSSLDKPSGGASNSGNNSNPGKSNRPGNNSRPSGQNQVNLNLDPRDVSVGSRSVSAEF